MTKEGNVLFSSFHFISASFTRLIAPVNQKARNPSPFLVSSSLNGWLLTPLSEELPMNSNPSFGNTYFSNSPQPFLTRSNAFLHASTLHGFFDATNTFFITLFLQTLYTNTSTPSHPLFSSFSFFFFLFRFVFVSYYSSSSSSSLSSAHPPQSHRLPYYKK